jgi:hypothetical protein
MTARAAVLVLACLLLGCFNRAAARIPGAAGAFHAASTGYVSTSPLPRAVRVALPGDARQAHLGENVAGTRWKGCDTDPFWGESAPGTLRADLARELHDSRVFERVVESGDDPSALVLETEIRALCAQAIGFLWLRVAGIVSLHFTLRDGDQLLYQRTIEKVVTDADDEYTGSQVAFIEQAMKVLISDSVREVFEVLVRDLDGLEPAGPVSD